MAFTSTFRYSSNAPCAMCHQNAPGAHTNVALTYSFNGTYNKIVEYNVPVCEYCKKAYEAPSIFGFRRWKLELKVRKWLDKYRIDERHL